MSHKKKHSQSSRRHGMKKLANMASKRNNPEAVQAFACLIARRRADPVKTAKGLLPNVMRQVAGISVR